jgi:hypothetical protein
MSKHDEMVIAVHESAHCVMSVVLGWRVRSVQLDPPRFDLVDELSDARRDHIRILAAGCAGELLLGREPVGGGTDDPEIASLLDATDNEAALRREVKLFIASNYPAVLRVARALLRKGYLDGEEIEQLVRGRTLPHGHP